MRKTGRGKQTEYKPTKEMNFAFHLYTIRSQDSSILNLFILTTLKNEKVRFLCYYVFET
jgi:hypothetical protein